jgi:formylglycine-generating enzyme
LTKLPADEPQRALKSSTYVAVAAVGLLVGLLSFGVLIAYGDRITRLGLVGNAFYVILIPLALGAVAFLFGAMNSAATFSGRVIPGYIQLSGPIVGAALVVAGGFYYANPATSYAVTVRVLSPNGDGATLTEGRVFMDFGTSRFSRDLNSSGEAEFKDLPPVARTAKVHIYLQAPDVAASDPNKTYDLSTGLIIIQTVPLAHKANQDRKASIADLIVAQETPLRPALVRIRSGSFIMGSPPNENGRELEEVQHRVILTHDFLMSVTDVTQAEYRQVMGDDPVTDRRTGIGRDCRAMGLGDENPVVCISWFEAIQFCNKLSELEGRPQTYAVQPTGVVWNKEALGYRLPTEAEWEYSARAGRSTPYWFGTSLDALDEFAWTRENSGHISHPVATKAANPWGLFDMHGEVWQMVWDRFAEYPTEALRDPAGPAEPTSSGREDLRVWRGGSWFAPANEARSAYRFRFEPKLYFGDLGFRVVRTLANRTTNSNLAATR